MSGNHLKLAQAAFDLGQYDLARQNVLRALADNPEEAWAHFTLGRSHLALGDHSSARMAAAEVIRFAPEWSGGFWLLGWGWILESGARVDSSTESRIMNARTAATNALALAPEDPVNQLLAATVEFEAGNWPGALNFAESGLCIAPENIELARLRANVLLKLERTSEAVAVFHDLLRCSPEDQVAHFLLAETHFARGEYRQARNHIIEALRLNPNSSRGQDLFWELVKTQHWLLRGAVRLQQLAEPLRRWNLIWFLAVCGIGLTIIAWLASSNRETGQYSRVLNALPFIIGAVAVFPAATELLPLFTNVLWMWLGRNRQQRRESSQEKWERIAIVIFLLGIPGHIALAAWLNSPLPAAWFWTLSGAVITQGVGVRLRRRWLRWLLFMLAFVNPLSMLVVSISWNWSGNPSPLIAAVIVNMAVSALCGAIYGDRQMQSAE